MRLLEVVKKLEWAGTSQMTGMRFCMGCTATWWKGAVEHKPDCEVAAAIATVEKIEFKIRDAGIQYPSSSPQLAALQVFTSELRALLNGDAS